MHRYYLKELNIYVPIHTYMYIPYETSLNKTKELINIIRNILYFIYPKGINFNLQPVPFVES